MEGKVSLINIVKRAIAHSALYLSLLFSAGCATFNNAKLVEMYPPFSKPTVEQQDNYSANHSEKLNITVDENIKLVENNALLEKKVVSKKDFGDTVLLHLSSDEHYKFLALIDNQNTFYKNTFYVLVTGKKYEISTNNPLDYKLLEGYRSAYPYRPYKEIEELEKSHSGLKDKLGIIEVVSSDFATEGMQVANYEKKSGETEYAFEFAIPNTPAKYKSSAIPDSSGFSLDDSLLAGSVNLNTSLSAAVNEEEYSINDSQDSAADFAVGNGNGKVSNNEGKKYAELIRNSEDGRTLWMIVYPGVKNIKNLEDAIKKYNSGDISQLERYTLKKWLDVITASSLDEMKKISKTIGEKSKDRLEPLNIGFAIKFDGYLNKVTAYYDYDQNKIIDVVGK